MKRTAFDEFNDGRTAENANADRRLMCSAHGCPNRWSVDPGQPLCSAHYHADPITWQRVTWEQQEAETDRAYKAQLPRQPKHVQLLTREQKLDALDRMRLVCRPNPDPRAWVTRLLERQARGEQLSAAQRDALAQVARAHFPTPTGEPA
jgi:hypothetical protein